MEQGFMVSDRPMLLDRLEEQPQDARLALIALAEADPRPTRIDVGVGVFRDSAGNTPILQCVKAAERILVESQQTKAYIGSQGDARFTALIRPLVFGEAAADDARIVGLQTPGGCGAPPRGEGAGDVARIVGLQPRGGCGALRLGAELIARANPNARIFAGEPTWPNHAPLIASAGVEMVAYPYYARDSRTICFDRMMDALGEAEAGDLVLLHGCCHNPTGADLDIDQRRGGPRAG